jgi:large subunit ribosomal protein L18
MATGPRYRVAFRRRREGKTDYHQRLKLIVSRKPRLVVRGTLGDYVAQIVITKPEGDRVLAAASARELVKAFGYKGATKNTTAAYLTGLLVALKAKKNGVDEAILDVGLATNRKGSKVYAALKGAIDAGLEVPCSDDIFPSDERIRGGHVAGNAKSNFSQYEKRGLKVTDLPAHFDEVKEKIMKAYEGK